MCKLDKCTSIDIRTSRIPVSIIFLSGIFGPVTTSKTKITVISFVVLVYNFYVQPERLMGWILINHNRKREFVYVQTSMFIKWLADLAFSISCQEQEFCVLFSLKRRKITCAPENVIFAGYSWFYFSPVCYKTKS